MPSTEAASSNRFLTLSNILSLSRAVLAVPFALVMLSAMPNSRIWGGVIMVAAALTDKLDGVFARKFHETTEWGKILDPLADKIGVATVAVVILYLGLIPLWFVAIVLARDALIFAGGLYLKSRRGIVLPSNEAGKWAVGIISLTLFLLVIGVQGIVTDVLMWATLAMLAISSFLYVSRFMKIMKQTQTQG